MEPASGLKRIVNDWWDRLLGAVVVGGVQAESEQYASNKTMRDFVCNSLGMGANGIILPVLSIIVTQLRGAEEAGMFTLAFITSTLLVFIGNYGMRTYQVSDLEEKHTFVDYQVSRVLTCVAMMVIGVLYCNLRGYADLMFLTCIGVFLYRTVEGMADVYEGRLQQCDKMYLAGISQAVRCAACFVVFVLALLITGDIGVSSVAMGVVAVISLFVVSLPLAMFETPRTISWSARSVVSLLKTCFPVFLALFLYAFIDNMPKFVMEGALTYDAQVYFNALYFPAQMILIIVQLVYKPLLVKIANIWADPKLRRRFDMLILGLIGVTVAITLVMMLFMGWVGIPLLSVLYGLDFEPLRVQCYIMLAVGGLTGVIDFLYQVITVLRAQRTVVAVYGMAFVLAIAVSLVCVNTMGLNGAVAAYLVSMILLAGLLVVAYLRLRRRFLDDPELAMEQAGLDVQVISIPGLRRQGAGGEDGEVDAYELLRRKGAVGFDELSGGDGDD